MLDTRVARVFIMPRLVDCGLRTAQGEQRGQGVARGTDTCACRRALSVLQCNFLLRSFFPFLSCLVLDRDL